MPETSKQKDQTNAKHHFLPKMYLEGFAEKGKVGIWQRDTGEVRYNAPQSVASVRGFYTFKDKKGDKSDELEKLLADMEGVVQRIIHNINSLFPPPIIGEYKFALAQYIAFQHLRTPEKRRELEQSADLMMKMQLRMGTQTREQIVSTLKKIGREPTEEAIKQVEDFQKNPHDYEIVPSKEDIIKVTLENLPLITQMLLHREWHVITFEAPSLITSDCPVLLMPDHSRPHYWLRGTGFANAGEIWFPLSSTRMLVLTHQDYKGPRKISGDLRMAYEANKIQLKASYMEAFGPPSIIQLYENKPLGARPLTSIDAGFDKDFFDHYNQPPARPRPVNK